MRSLRELLLRFLLGHRAPGADLTRPVNERERQAEWRWAENNRQARLAGCPCGAPAEVAERDADVVGTVPFEWWTCRAHRGATMFSGREACWEHLEPCPLGERRGHAGRIGEPPSRFYCPHRTHGEE
jgi:hypothetical protein